MRMHTLSGALAALALSAASLLAHEYKIGSIQIDHPWARATAPGAKVGGGFVAIRNGGGEADRLVKVEAGFSGRVELHEMKVEGGIMQMRPLADGIEIAPGGETVLKPGDLHIMFIDLKEPLKEGETRKAKLVFQKAGEIEVEFKIEALGASADPHAKKN